MTDASVDPILASVEDPPITPGDVAAVPNGHPSLLQPHAAILDVKATRLGVRQLAFGDLLVNPGVLALQTIVHLLSPGMGLLPWGVRARAR